MDIAAEDRETFEIVVPERLTVKRTASTSSVSGCSTYSNVLSDQEQEDTDTHGEYENAPRSLNALFDGKFFKIVDESNQTLSAECQFCFPQTQVIRGRRNATSNFINHMRRKHVDQYKNYLEYKKEKQEGIRAKKRIKLSTDKTKTQISLKESLNRPKKISQCDFDQRLLKFVINTMSPISIVDNPNFINLFEGMGLNIISRGTVTKKIFDLSKKHIDETKLILQNVQYVCTTADIWSSKKRSFLGVTCHWLDSDTLQRKSVALACRRFSGTHSFDRIAELIDEIHGNFNLNYNKITATVTDNASNFIKAFKEFGVNMSLDVLVNSISNDNIDETEMADESEEISDTIFVPSAYVEEENEKIYNLHLPNHQRCISHLINLIASSDSLKIMNKNEAIRSKHTKIMNKCSQLWNKAGRPKSAEIIKHVLGHSLSYPGVTRWNSYFDSITQILNVQDKLPTLSEQLGLKNGLKDNEIEYLSEYVKILKPLALALDILQGEHNTHFGYIIPTIGSMYFKLKTLKDDKLKYLQPVLDGIIKSTFVRFEEYLTLNTDNQKTVSAALASVCHPKFKLRWVNLCERNTVDGLQCNTSDYIKKLFLNTINEVATPYDNNYQNVDSHSHDDKENTDFFEFEVISSSNTPFQGERELQALQYLQDPDVNISMLNKYPLVKRLFLKFNTTLPSSAPVERLFSYATFINTPRRHALSDKTFENLVILKANNI